MKDGTVDLGFADPPYNIGYDYGDEEYKDNLKPSEYLTWSVNWMDEMYRVLKPDGSFWMMIGDEWAADLKVKARELGFHTRSWVIWYYTFGVNCSKKFSRSHVHIFYFTKHPKKFTFNETQVRVPSARALVYNDKRANPDGRLPDDTWILRPQDIPEGFDPMSDTWTFSRVCGTFKQRQAGAANQLPEQLVGRIMRACSNEGDLVLDPMAGTGTTLAVAKKLKRNYIGFELSSNYSDMIRKRLRTCKPGDPLDGPISPGG
jgi:site-specific DNA-methyltransferase (adenine-specific)